MANLVEERTRHFYRWERRGRGWRIYPYPVNLEPPFIPFRFINQPARVVDDSKHHTFLSGLLERFSKKQERPPLPEIEIEPVPEPATEEEPVELRVLLSKDLSVTSALSEGFLKSLASVRDPASFELVGSGGQISVILTARSRDVPLLSSQLRTFFPAVSLEEGEEILLSAWEAGEEGVFSAAELGLAHEFMLPLERVRSFTPDPLTAIVGALAEAKVGEVAIVQVLFQGVTAPWAANAALSVVTPSGVPTIMEN